MNARPHFNIDTTLWTLIHDGEFRTFASEYELQQAILRDQPEPFTVIECNADEDHCRDVTLDYEFLIGLGGEESEHRSYHNQRRYERSMRTF